MQKRLVGGGRGGPGFEGDVEEEEEDSEGGGREEGRAGEVKNGTQV